MSCCTRLVFAKWTWKPLQSMPRDGPLLCACPDLSTDLVWPDRSSVSKLSLGGFSTDVTCSYQQTGLWVLTFYIIVCFSPCMSRMWLQWCCFCGSVCNHMWSAVLQWTTSGVPCAVSQPDGNSWLFLLSVTIITLANMVRFLDGPTFKDQTFDTNAWCKLLYNL